MTVPKSLILTLSICFCGYGSAFQTPALKKPSWNRSSPTCTSLKSSLLSELTNGYNTLLDTFPLATQMVTASVLAGVGDAMAQIQQDDNDNETTASSPADTFTLRLLDQPKQVDLERLRRFMLKGLGGGVIWSYWFALNDQWTNEAMMQPLWLQGDQSVTLLSLLGGAAEGETPVSVAIGKTIVAILLEQFIAVPIIYTFWDIPVPTLLSKTQDNQSIPLQVQQKLPALLVDNAKVWTVANLVVYNSPLQYRVLVSSVADIVWQSILSSHVMTTEPEEDVLAKQDEPLLDGILRPSAAEATAKAGAQTGDVTL